MEAATAPTTASETLDAFERLATQITSRSGHKFRFRRGIASLYLRDGVWHEGPVAYGFVASGIAPTHALLELLAVAHRTGAEIGLDERGRLVVTEAD